MSKPVLNPDTSFPNTADTQTKKGYYGSYGGQLVPPPLLPVLAEVDDCFQKCRQDPQFFKELNYYLREYVGRPNPLYLCQRLTDSLGGAKIYMKREDLNHTGAHKINNCIGQALLAVKMGKKRVIAETGAGQHGVATATVCAMFGLECHVYMGDVDVHRQALNVFRMRMLGAEVIPVKQGGAQLKDAVDAALVDLVTNAKTTFYLLGSAVGPHPYPQIVHYFQSIVSHESRQQVLEKEKRLPDIVCACVGGGSNAIGAFSAYIPDKQVQLVGVEPLGKGPKVGENAASLNFGKPGDIHGFHCYLLQDSKGEPGPTHSIAAGLDYPGVGPEHSYLKDIGRATYATVSDDEALAALELLSKREGIIPALESAHAVAYAIREAPKLGKDKIIICNLSGRGDKDMEQIARMRGVQI